MPEIALVIAVPLLMAGLLAALRTWMWRPLAQGLALGAAGGVLAAALRLLQSSLRAPQLYWFGGWLPRGAAVIGVGFAIEPLGASLAVLVALLVLVALVYALPQKDDARGYFLPLMLVFLAAMCGFTLTADLFNLFVFFELMSIAAFALCGMQSGEPAPLQGAFNFAIANSVGAFLLLTGIAMVYAVTGALNLAQIGQALEGRHDALVTAAFTLIATGFLIKGAMVPFHFWLADAHAVAPTPACVLFSGVMVPLGLFGVARVAATGFGGLTAAAGGGHAGGFRLVMVGFGVLTAAVGAVMCFAQHHLKRMLAFSTVGHVGLMLIGFGMAQAGALAGTMAYVGGHGLVKGGLFMLAGIVLDRRHTLSERRLFGKCCRLRFTGAFWFLGGLGLAGLPPFATAAGADWIHAGAESLGLGWVHWVMWGVGVLTGAAVIRSGVRVFVGWGEAPPSDPSADLPESSETQTDSDHTPAAMFVPAAFAITGGLLLAYLPHLHSFALRAAGGFLDQGRYIHLIYTGRALPAYPATDATRFSSLVEGWSAAAAAALIAAAAVWHRRLPRRLRLLSHLEGPLDPLRALHTGHAGDYVAWITLGAATLGGALLLAWR